MTEKAKSQSAKFKDAGRDLEAEPQGEEQPGIGLG